MQKKLIFPFLIITLIVYVSLAQIKFFNYTTYFKTNYITSNPWKSIDSLKEIGQYQKAYEITYALINKSYETKNYINFLKAIIYCNDLCRYFDETPLSTQNQLLTKWEEKGPNWCKAILYSLKAEQLQGYLNNHYFTNTAWNDESDNPENWSENQLKNQIAYYYLNSLNKQQNIDSVTLFQIEDILETNREMRKFKPGLYDLLAWRSLNYFMLNTNKTIIEDSTIKQTDSIVAVANNNYLQLSLNLFNTLIKKHNYALEPKFYNQLELLKFIYQINLSEKKDSIYENGLQLLINQYAKNEIVVLAYNELAKLYIEQSEFKTNTNRLILPKTLQLLQKAIKQFPKSDWIAETKNLEQTILAPSLMLYNANYFTPEQQLLFSVEYKNCKNLYIRIIPISQEKDLTYTFYEKKGIKTLLNKKPILEKNYELPSVNDYRKHSLLIKENNLPIGKYVVLFSSNANALNDTSITGFTTLNVSNIQVSTQKINNHQLLILINNKTTGEPINNAELTIYALKYNHIKERHEQELYISGNTNNKGFFILEIPSNEGNYKLCVKYKNEEFMDNIYLYKDYFNEYGITTHSKIITDRSLYRPGQEVHIKGIVFDNKLQKVIANKTVSLSINDANGQTVTTFPLQTNFFGSYSTHFIIPQHLLTGTFWINDGFSTTSFQVEEYKRPKFEITFCNSKSENRPNKPITIYAKATALSGQPLINAKVSAEIYRYINLYPMPWEKIVMPQVNQELINHIQLTTNDTGGIIIQFKTNSPSNINNQTLIHYKVKLQVTDINGETQNAEKDITTSLLGYKTIATYNKQYTNSYLIDEVSDTTTITFTATDFDNQPLNKKFSLTTYQLQEPAQPLYKITNLETDTFLPNFKDIFEQQKLSNPDNWKIIKQENTQLIEANQSYKISHLIKNVGSTYKLIITDEQNQIILTQYLTITKSNLFKKNLNWFNSFLNKSEYQPGDTAQIQISINQEKGTVFYAIEEPNATHQNNTINYNQLKITNYTAKLAIPITFNHYDNIYITLFYIQNGQTFIKNHTINVPSNNKKLKLNINHIKDSYYPGSNERWVLEVKDNQGKNFSGETTVSIYDASLDLLLPHQINTTFVSDNFQHYHFNTLQQSYFVYPNVLQYPATTYYKTKLWVFDKILYTDNMFFSNYNKGYNTPMMNLTTSENQLIKRNGKEDAAATAPKQTILNDNNTNEKNEKNTNRYSNLIINQPRKNFNETALFQPHLLANSNGEYIIETKLPESLTKWKMMVFTHGTQLEYGYYETTFKTAKPIMCTSNLPRFINQGDEITLKAKLDNTTNESQTIQVELLLENKENNKNLNGCIKDPINKIITIKPKQSAFVSWNIQLTEDVNILKTTIKATNHSFSDIEINYLPVLSNRVLITEALPIVADTSEFNFEFTSLINNPSKTINTINYTLEYSSNPVWNVIKYLPHLLKNNNQSSEEIFARFFANTIALNILMKNPEIETVFKDWEKNKGQSLSSKLKLNDELKQIMLSETPWVTANKTEEEQKQELASLFNRDELTYNLQYTAQQLINNQLPNGAWPWYNGMYYDYYITLYITNGIARLFNLKIIQEEEYPLLAECLTKAMRFISSQQTDNYRKLKKQLKEEDIQNYIPSFSDLLTLELFSYSTNQHSLKDEVFNFYITQAKKHWKQLSLPEKIILSKILYRKNDSTGKIIADALKDLLIKNSKTGYYWKENILTNTPTIKGIEAHAEAIELFTNCYADSVTTKNLVKWLLLNNRSNYWYNSKTTSIAIYHLLLANPLQNTTNEAEIIIGTNRYQINKQNAEAGTCYIKKIIPPPSTHLSTLAKGKIIQPLNTISYGALYWQYTELTDKINKPNSELTIEKKYFVKKIISGQEAWIPIEKTPVLLGDELKVTIKITTPYPMQYIHIKDYRPAGTEPTDVISATHYQNNICYYKSVSDAVVNFFIAELTKGTYTLTYHLKANNKGVFKTGITQLQCLYAPELTTHTTSKTLQIND